MAAIFSGLIAALSLASCAARAPESRPAPPSVEYFPAGVPIPASLLPVPAARLGTQPTPVDVAVPGSEYPPEALDTNFEGTVLLRILIDETGRVREAKVVKDPGRGMGEAAARSALAHFRFSPPRVDGKPVATWWMFVVRYELPRR